MLLYPSNSHLHLRPKSFRGFSNNMSRYYVQSLNQFRCLRRVGDKALLLESVYLNYEDAHSTISTQHNHLLDPVTCLL